jgi:glycosyltransferase involved in cell wall biosynthesis
MQGFMKKFCMKIQHKKVLFLVPYPLRQAPSQRFRVEQFLPVLDNAGMEWKIQSFLDQNTWNRLYQGGNYFLKAWGVMKGFLKRWKTVLFGLYGIEFVFIHREAAPLGPPVFEWIIAKVFRKKIIFDFDDAIWIPNTTATNKIAGWFKCFWKVKYICRWAYRVVGGNEFLCSYANQFNQNVICIPTSVDTEKSHNRLKAHRQANDKIVIGWTGSHSTTKYLGEVVPVLQQLEKEMPFSFLVISDEAPALPLNNYLYCPWNEQSEADDLLKMDIGIMPLAHDQWSEGKCGFKLIQYMSLGIPAVASPVGVNKKIIQNGVTGFLCSSDNEWLVALRKLCTDAGLRNSMGAAGRQFMEENYSLKKQMPVFLELFQ